MMTVRITNMGFGTYRVHVKHARRLGMATEIKVCADRADVKDFVKVQAQCNKDCRERLRARAVLD